MSEAPDQAELLKEAVTYLRDAESAWRQQAEFALGHAVGLIIDYDSLGGHYDWLQPFVQQAIGGSLGALTGVGFDPQCRDALGAAIQRVQIACAGGEPRPGPASEVTIDGGLLTMRVPLVVTAPGAPAPRRPIDPTFDIANGIRRALGLPEQTPPQPLPGEAGDDGTQCADADGEAAGPNAGPNDGPNDGHDVEPSQDESDDTELVEFAPRAPGASEAALQGRYAHAEKLTQKLEAVMRELDIWPGDPPPGPIEIRGAFGCQNMAFTQWLAWVLIPVLYQTIDEHGEFPSESDLAAYCVRELSGMHGEKMLHDVLYAIDHLGGRKRRR